jgi:hypothetical protein
MLHYTCDLCKRDIDADELRYVVKLEVFAALDPAECEELEEDRDHLLEVQELLEGLTDEEAGDDAYCQAQYDLCPECARKFRKDPLGRDLSKQFQFSTN